MEHLRDFRPNQQPSLGGWRNVLSTATQRKYLSALGNLLQRAKGKGLVTTNVVEFAQLGAMRPVVDGISLVGGYGILFWLIVQDITQLKGLYRDRWETLIANRDVKQCFGTNDWTTADLLSKLGGETTVFTEGGSSGRGQSYGRSGGSSRNYGESVSEKGRRLLMPDEIFRLPQSQELLFAKGSPPLRVHKVNCLLAELTYTTAGSPPGGW